MHTPVVLRRFALLTSSALLLSLAACSSQQELYGQLTERQANEMVAVLLNEGIDATKESKDGQFAISTKRDAFPAAVSALKAQGYPRENFDSMGKVFKREGFVSSPLEERARLSYSMSQEIANTINNIDGVITARVHLVMPEQNPLNDKPQPSAASVFIKHRADRNLSSQVPQIKALVINSIEGLRYDNVTVALFPAEVGSSDGGRAAGEAKAAKAAAAAAQSPVASLMANPNMPLLAGGGIGMFALGAGLVLGWRRRSGGHSHDHAGHDHASHVNTGPRKSADGENRK